MVDKCAMLPDLEFIRQVTTLGGEDLKKCYQCSTCTVVCPLSPDNGPFPRKEMIWAQWGMKDNIFTRPDIWLCHQCNDCSIHCPRGAKPGNVLATLRSLFIRHYSIPVWLYDVLHDRSRLSTAVGIPVVFLAAVLIILGTFGMLNKHPGIVMYANMMPHLALNTLFTLLVFLDALVFAFAVFRYWTAMSRTAGIACAVTVESLKQSWWPALREILTHERFVKCETSKTRYFAHLLMLYSFIGLLITTSAAVFSIVLFDYYPLRMTNLFKILGNLSGVGLIAGIVLVIYERLRGPKQEKIGAGSYTDWMLIVVLGTVGITGLLCQFLRLADLATLAYPMYFIHLVAVFYLLIYSPYSKFAHMVYRTEALLFSRYVELEKARGITVCKA
jgi:quinone-modifying oxidoreductase, subunit QmoC